MKLSERVAKIAKTIEAQRALNWAAITTKAEDLSIEIEGLVEFSKGTVRKAPYEIQVEQLKEKFEALKLVIRNRLDDIEREIR